MMEAFGRTMGGLKPMHFPRSGRATSHGHSRLGLYIRKFEYETICFTAREEGTIYHRRFSGYYFAPRVW